MMRTLLTTMTWRRLAALALGSCCPLLFAQTPPAPLQEPLAAIEAGDLIVEAVAFLSLPATAESAAPPQTNTARARIQGLHPLPDGSGRLAINDLRGPLYLSDEQGSAPVVYLDLREADVDFDDSMFPNETGLAGIAFHPEFGRRDQPGYGKFYTAYSAAPHSGRPDYLADEADNHHSVIREWTARDHAANRFSGESRELLRVGQFAQNHNVGSLAFNPAARPGDADYGLLYASFGDGGGANDPNENGQDLSNPLSSIIRIDPLARSNGRAYGIPVDNPFRDNPEAAPEIWVYGLRHPQHFSFDETGRLFIADIGQAQVEEVNIGQRGANYGWRFREGSFATAFDPLYFGRVRPNPVYPVPPGDGDYTYPVLEYGHFGSAAISSVLVYTGSDIPTLAGKLLFSDMVSGRIYYADREALRPGGAGTPRALRLRMDGREVNLAEAIGYENTYARGSRAGLRLGQDARGEIYLLSKGDGKIRKLVSPGDQ